MLVSSGSNDDINWFQYRAEFFGQVQRVEWDAGTMFAALPNDTAGWLLNRGYARLATDEEVEQHTSPPVEAEPQAEKPRPKKGEAA
jgi:hypothetical protein